MNATMRVLRTVLALVPLYATTVLAQQGAMTGAVGETPTGLAAV